MLHIRRAEPTDWPAIWAMLEPVFRAGETYAVDRDITQHAAQVMWMDAPVESYVATDGDILGTFYIKTNHHGGGSHVCNCGYVVGVDAQGQGVAAQMCAASQTQARAQGYRAMQFNFVLTTNTGAIRLWERAGFAEVGRLPGVFLHPLEGYVDALVMHKSLLES